MSRCAIVRVEQIPQLQGQYLFLSASRRKRCWRRRRVIGLAFAIFVAFAR